MVPVPEQVGHVLAIWNPLSITNVRVPDPPQVVHADRLAPDLSPVPEHVEQLTTGVTLTVRDVPLHASRKEIPMVVCKLLPCSKPCD